MTEEHKLSARVLYSKKEGDIRTRFQHDRDRILYSKAFRRLSGKTQVFLTGLDDHRRTRLTHTLEVSQIARTISGNLNLDVDLTEAIALGHDLGHTPFGHAGERVLNLFTSGCVGYKNFNIEDTLRYKFLAGFKHNWQSVRIVTDITTYNDKRNGLDLSPEVVWGILHHSSTKYDKCKLRYYDGTEFLCTYRNINTKCDNELSTSFYDLYSEYDNNKYFTFEAIVVGIADEIAQRHHDLEDSLLSNLIEFIECKNFFPQIKNYVDELNYLSEVVNQYITKTISHFASILKSCSKFSLESLRVIPKKVEELRSELKLENYLPEDSKVHEFLKSRVLLAHETQKMDGRAFFIIQRIYKAYLSNPQQLPDLTIKQVFNNFNNILGGNSQYSIKFRDRLKDKDLILVDKILEGINKIDEETKAKFLNFKSMIFLIPNRFDKNNKYDSYKRIDAANNHEMSAYRKLLKETRLSENKPFAMILLRTITDHIAGMTDRKAIETYQKLYAIDTLI